MHVLYRFGVGGLENGMVNLINRLPAGDYHHIIVALTACDRGYLERLESSNFECHDINKRPGHDFHAWRRIFELIRQVRPDVLHTRNLGTLEIQLLGWLARVPVRIHGEHGWDVNDLNGQVRKYQRFRRFMGCFVHAWIALSRDLESYLTVRVPISRARVHTICNGVDCEHFQPRGRLDDGRLTFGTVGRLATVKNQTLLCGAFVSLLRRHPEWRQRVQLRIVGDGPLRAACEAIVEEGGMADQVVFAGESDRVAEEMRKMDVFVLPSLNEGISNTILEAMASGLPIVAFRVGGNSELVEDGANGALIPEPGEDGLTEALSRYVDSSELIAKHGRASRVRAEHLFSLQTMVDSYAALYAQLLDSHASSGRA